MLDDLKTQLGSSMHTVRRFFDRPITLKQGNVMLGVPAKAQREQEREERRQRVKQMTRDLYRLLEQHPGSRQVMRHLDLAERTLRTKGFAAFEALPIRVLAKALRQMEQIVWDWSPVGLAELRSRLAVMVKSRAGELSAAAATTMAPEIDAEVELDHSGRADVTEVEHEQFEEMERSWLGRMPEPVPQTTA